MILVTKPSSQSQKVLKDNVCFLYSNSNFVHLTFMKDAAISIV